jgi:hypothetical protein
MKTSAIIHFGKEKPRGPVVREPSGFFPCGIHDKRRLVPGWTRPNRVPRRPCMYYVLAVTTRRSKALSGTRVRKDDPDASNGLLGLGDKRART